MEEVRGLIKAINPNPTAILKNLGSICRAISLIEPQHIVGIQVNDVVGLS
ncbi:hypothetical protein [Candidatus Hakubella thermalkaliphila]|nr:hypothetical protein [Candidatus Hakubella thermalkaliphila]